MILRLQKGVAQLSHIRSRGGHCSRRYRFIDFHRFFVGLPGKIIRFEYDPYRNVRLMVIVYLNGVFCYLLASQGVQLGQLLYCSTPNYIIPGSSMLLLYVPLGSLIHNIENRPGSGGVLFRSAGCFAKLLTRNWDSGFVFIQKKHGLRLKLSVFCKATIGTLSNNNIKLLPLRSAGQARRLGKRPIVRGVARNPVDHPNGGRTVGGKVFKSVWGKLLKHIKTANNLNLNFYIRPLSL